MRESSINNFWFMGLILTALFLAISLTGCGGQGAAPSKAITAYSLDGVAGTINETAKNISVTMPYGTDVTPLARPGCNSQLYCMLHQGDPPGTPLQKR